MTSQDQTTAERRDATILAGHRGDADTARAAISDPEPAVRLVGFGALERCGVLADDDIRMAMTDASVPVRRRAAELAALRPHLTLIDLLHDVEPTVVEVAAWACGEHEDVSDAELERLIAARESEQAKLDTRLADPALYSGPRAAVDELTAARATLAEEIATLYARWEALEGLRSSGS